MHWNLNTNYLKEQLSMMRCIYQCNGLQRSCSKSSIPAVKYHKMTEQADSLGTAVMQIPFWNMRPRIFLHTAQQQNPQLHYRENLSHPYLSLQSNCTILQSNLSHAHSLFFISQVTTSHCFNHTRELHAKMVSIYKSGNSCHVPPECTTQACLECEDKHKKTVRTAMLFVAVTWKVQIRRISTSTWSVDQTLKLMVKISDWNLLT
jgi:hypothetical protein